MNKAEDTFVTMTLMKDITNVPPSGEALLRVYRDRLVLNAQAKRLLDLKDDSKVSFRTSVESGMKRLYISRKPYSAYGLYKVNDRYCINSRSLCKAVSDVLQGYGTYRIEGENPVRDFNGDVCYSVFFRKY